jgi:O-antigen/teichoic acid export membrane protein
MIDRGTNSNESKLSFGIRDLIALTSVAGVVLALGTTFLPQIPALPQSASNFDVLLTLLAVAGALSVITLTEVWTMMGHRSRWKVPVSLSIVAVAFVGACLGLPHVDRWIWAAAIASTVSAPCVLLYLLRLEGWRFVSSFKVEARITHVESPIQSMGDV